MVKISLQFVVDTCNATSLFFFLTDQFNGQVARSGHSVLRASSVLILFGGEDAKRRKLNDLHMFDLKSLTWLPLHCT